MAVGPPSIATIIELQGVLLLHCNGCGRDAYYYPQLMPERLRPFTAPQLAGRFRCGDCGSRKTTARHLYPAARCLTPGIARFHR